MEACTEWSGLTGPASTARLSCGCLWFLHIGKTGGTTVEKHIQHTAKNRGWAYEQMYGRHSWKKWNTSLGWRRVASELQRPAPRVAIVSQHHTSPGLGGADNFLGTTILPLRRALEDKGCKLVLVTVLREPVARTISSLFFNHVPRQTIPKWAADFGANYQAKYLIGGWHLASRASGEELMPDASMHALLAPARAVLSQMDLVGRTEELGNFIAALDRILGVRAPALSQAADGTLKTTHYNQGKTKRYNLTYAELRVLRHNNRVDNSLYYGYCVNATHSRAAALSALRRGVAGSGPSDRSLTLHLREARK